MNENSLIPTLQYEALAREVARQFDAECGAVIAAAQRDALTIVAQARAAARRRVHQAIVELRQEGANRLATAAAQCDTERRARIQRLAAQAVRDAEPLLEETLNARWRSADSRKQWSAAIARLCVLRLRPGCWRVVHPAGWSESEQREFVEMIGARDGGDIGFKADDAVKAGLRIEADGAVLDGTPPGLLADRRFVAAQILDEIGQQ